MANKDSKLRVFLRNAPQPAKVRARKGDEEQDIVLTENLRHRWRVAEEAAISWGAETVECLDSKGALLRTFTIEREDADERDDKRAANAKGAEYRGLGEVISRIAETHNEAFDKGAEAAARALESQTNLVEILTVHLTTAITSMYNVSANYANLLAGKEPDADTGNSQAAMMNLLGAAMARLGQSAPQASPKPPQNGKG